MSQRKIYLILKELGGTASQSDIRRYAKEKYPDSSLYLYITIRLRQLKKWGYIDLVDYEKKIWKIVRDNFP